MEILETIKDCHKNWNIYDNWDTKNQRKNAKKKYLFSKQKKDNPREFENLKNKSDILMRTVNILDNASENAAENMQLATENVSGSILLIPALLFSGLSLKAVFKGCKQFEKTKKFPFSTYAFLYVAPALGILDIPFVLWKTKKQIEASRVARAKAREEELKDIKNFVTYTPEQIEQAKKIAKTISNKDIQDEDKKNISLKNAFKATLNIDKEYNQYLKKYQENLGIDKKMQAKLSENYSDKELLEAKKDKELILTGIKEINNNAEKYCENAEAAFATLRLFNFAITVPAMFVVKKLMNACFPKTKELIKTAVSLYTPLIVLLPIGFWFNKKQKEAAKVGRFKMKQEFSKDLSKLAYFDKEELDKVNNINIKSTKINIFKRVINNFKFIPQYLKDREEYLNYKNTTWLEEEKLNKALKTISISDKQKNDAQKMQEKIFFVFDELDEMSQKYSEHIEGAIGLSQKILNIIKGTLFISAFTVPMYLLFSGGLHVTKLIKKVSDIIFDKNSQMKKNIDEIYKIAQNDSKVKNMIDKLSIVDKKSQKALLTEPKIAKQCQNIINLINQASISETAKKDFINKELKHSHFANWIKNMTFETGNIILRKLQKIPIDNINKMENEKIKEFLLNLKNCNIPKSNLKTLKLTALGLAIPVFVGVVSISYMLNSFFAHLQKKAGYIGVMKSIKKIDNEKYFAIKESNKESKNQNFGNFNTNYFVAFNTQQ